MKPTRRIPDAGLRLPPVDLLPPTLGDEVERYARISAQTVEARRALDAAAEAVRLAEGTDLDAQATSIRTGAKAPKASLPDAQQAHAAAQQQHAACRLAAEQQMAVIADVITDLGADWSDQLDEDLVAARRQLEAAVEAVDEALVRVGVVRELATWAEGFPRSYNARPVRLRSWEAQKSEFAAIIDPPREQARYLHPVPSTGDSASSGPSAA